MAKIMLNVYARVTDETLGRFEDAVNTPTILEVWHVSSYATEHPELVQKLQALGVGWEEIEEMVDSVNGILEDNIAQLERMEKADD